MKTFDVFWSPEGRHIFTVDAVDAHKAIRKAPKPYRKFLGELYALAVVNGDARCDVTPTCPRHGAH